ncbi:SPOR domain-containing protein [Sphingomonas sp.]|uniref:SPOR domain-containing protein n=1 Tax=Sphingomonas sp. TaxID=28214 RepID=UPI0031DF4E1F
MTFPFLSRARLALALALSTAPVPLLAQEVVQPLPGTTDADRLGDVMRRVAQNPRDVGALVEAAELSIRLDDLSGAASLLARAEKVDPRDPRIKAGMGSILVRSERPGEALRYFAQAESAGLSPATFAADRGLAYDLTGDQPRAQRDYRLALSTAPDDEVLRRYALSLGISGQRERALEQLDPLLRKTDRAAWRARAFILAMGGDLGEATRIANTMMPAQLAQGLQPFLQRLPTLPAVDRAFAVHFGETRATPERLADARLAPTLAPLAPEAPVALAAASTTPVAATPVRAGESRRGGRRSGREARGSTLADARTVAPVVAATPASTQLASTVPPRAVQPQPGFATALPAPTTGSSAPVAVAATTGPMIQPLPAAPVAAPPSRLAQTTATVQPLPATATATATATAMPSQSPPAAVAPMQMVQAIPVEPKPAPVATTPAEPVKPAPVAVAAALPEPPKPEPVTRASRGGGRRPSLAAARAVREDSVLARIVANLSIPASELGVEEPERRAALAANASMGSGSQRVLAEARAKVERDHEAREKAAEAIEPAARPSTRDAKTAAADRKAQQAKALADKKAAAAKKAEAEKKALADKAEQEEKRRARANPERIWVQVAGGANEDDLSKAWAATKAKAPAVFAGKQGYKTPLRATHRVLTGPFKTDAEARAFVNKLAKQGVSAFPVTSEAGQAVTRLDAK